MHSSPQRFCPESHVRGFIGSGGGTSGGSTLMPESVRAGGGAASSEGFAGDASLSEASALASSASTPESL